MKLTTALRTTIVTDIITAAGTNPKLKYYNGTESLTPAGTLLATLTITGALGTASSGVIDFNETVTQTNASHGAGTARAYQMGPQEGVVASLVMMLSGVVVVLAAPLVRWLMF